MTDDDHPIYGLAEQEPEIFYMDNELALALIDEDEDEDIPIFGVALTSGAYCVFYPHEGGSMMRVLHVNNSEENTGELKKMMNFITHHFGVTDIEFFNVTNKELISKLHNPSTKTIQIDDPRFDEPQKVLVARVSWNQ